MYGLLNSENIFDLRWPLKVKGQGQTLKTLKSNILKTVQDIIIIITNISVPSRKVPEHGGGHTNARINQIKEYMHDTTE